MNDNHKIDMLKTNIAAGTNGIRCWNCWNVIYTLCIAFSATSSSCLLFEFNFVNRNLIPFRWKDDKYQLPLAMISTSNKRKKKKSSNKKKPKDSFYSCCFVGILLLPWFFWSVSLFDDGHFFWTLPRKMCAKRLREQLNVI